MGLVVVAGLVLSAVSLATGWGHRTPQSTTTWIPDAALPSAFESLDAASAGQPTVDPDGVDHELTACTVTDHHVTARATVHNPYDETLDALMVLTVDTATEGIVWGFYTANLVPGSSAVAFDSDDLDVEAGTAFSDQLRSGADNGRNISSCSMHLVGFSTPGVYDVAPPVISLADAG